MKKKVAKVKVTLVKSLIASKPKTKANAASLGLKKIGDFAVVVDDATLAGKVRALAHLVTVEPVDEKNA